MMLIANVFLLLILIAISFNPNAGILFDPNSGNILSPSSGRCSDGLPYLTGLRVDSDEISGYTMEGIVKIPPGVSVSVRFLGCNLDRIHFLKFTNDRSFCSSNSSKFIDFFVVHGDESVTFQTKFTDFDLGEFFYVCFAIVSRNFSGEFLSNDADLDFFHQGPEPYKSLFVRRKIRTYYLSLPIQIPFLIVLFLISGLFSGLNLGLMALTEAELKLVQKSGTQMERKYAEIILPVRKKGNYLLCSILYANVIVNSAISILFDDLTSGLIALIGSSIGIVIVGEILPQSLCSRYGLFIGAKTIWITKFFMYLTFPLSFPTAKVLDCLLGKEVREVFNKERLLEIIRMSNANAPIECREVKIVTGALELSKKCAKDAMTDIQDVFMLPGDSLLDTKTISEIIRVGYTRIPIYERTKENVVALLNVKDLLLLDPEDKLPLKTVCQFYARPMRFVFDDMPIQDLLEEFKKGQYHMAFVNRIKSDGEGDPVYELVGIVTLEDIIEEIIQEEILDETDTVMDNRKKLRRKDLKTYDLSAIFDDDTVKISPQLALAAYQFLSTTIPAFNATKIAPAVLQKLIQGNCYKILPSADSDGDCADCYLYRKDQPSNRFILILDGQVEMRIGQANFSMMVGAFFYFGDAALGDESGEFVPDFSVKIVEQVSYLQIKSSTYTKAITASAFTTTSSNNGMKRQLSDQPIIVVSDADEDQSKNNFNFSSLMKKESLKSNGSFSSFSGINSTQ